MGKKRVVQKTKEELLKEREKVESGVKKDVKAKKGLASREGRVYISSSYNNTVITLTNSSGDVLTWSSAGSIGFKGTKKATPFAASKVAESISFAAGKLGVDKVSIFVKGIGSGRDSAIRSLVNKGLEITAIKDVTPMPHNGCRPRKARRA